MSFSSFAIVMFSAFALAVLGVVFVRFSHRKALQRRLARKELLQRIERLPLPKMMKALGVGIGQYFYKASLDDIEDSISLCEKCPSEEICRTKLRIPELNPDDVNFCPNQEHLSQYSRASRIRR